MIFAHVIIGAMPLVDNQFSWFWLVGSVIPDVDHLFVLYRHKIFSCEKLVKVMRFEDKYNLRFKTKYMHSVFGAVVTSIPIFFISHQGGAYYFTAYIIHLILDWPDIDEKQYFYPFRTKIRGWLPIFSKWEIIFTVILVLVLFGFYC
jgi:hypothetical protein